MRTRRRSLLAAACAAAWVASHGVAVAAEAQGAKPAAAPNIAVVDGKPVSRVEFERAFATAARNKFYHREAPAGQVEALRREVADTLVNRALLVAAAEARGIEADEGPIREALEGYERRYGASEQWKQIRETRWPALRRELAEQQLLARLEARVRDVAAPDEKAVRAFYDANAGLFTEPERVHVSVILLKVDPSATPVVREKAREEARALHARLEKGADFAETARLHSADASAAKGGDLGYLHRGMLAANLHESIDALEPDKVSAPVDVLEGVAIFKLHRRAKPTLRDFEAVKARAMELLRRDLSDRAWKDFVAGLRAAARVEMDPSWLATAAPPAH